MNDRTSLPPGTLELKPRRVLQCLVGCGVVLGNSAAEPPRPAGVTASSPPVSENRRSREEPEEDKTQVSGHCVPRTSRRSEHKGSGSGQKRREQAV